MLEELKAELIRLEAFRPWREPLNDLGRNYNLGYQHAIQRVIRFLEASAATTESKGEN